MAPLSVQTPKMQDWPFHFCVLAQQTPPRGTHWLVPFAQAASAGGGFQTRAERTRAKASRAARTSLLDIGRSPFEKPFQRSRMDSHKERVA
jgi:hypothetical protein